MLDLKTYDIQKNDSLIAAVSGGPDSMALLDMLVSSGYLPTVCHINYHKRETSNRDEMIVREYCALHSLEIYVLSAVEPTGNFQNWAREKRYEFFKKIYDKKEAKALVVAHQQDDALETYLFKKMRKSVGDSLTIREEENIYQMRVIRPLLNLSKADLRQYCLTNDITFGDDETNFTKHYTRNAIRLDIVSQLSAEDRHKLIAEMKKNEDEWQVKRQHALAIIHDSKINYSEFANLTEEEKRIALFELIVGFCPELGKHLVGSRLNEIIKEFVSPKPNIIIELAGTIVMNKSYDIISVINNETVSYSYRLDSLETMDTRYFSVALTGVKMEGVQVMPTDFPLTIRTYQPDDYINLKAGHKSLKRLFIDKKIPVWQRKTWPIVTNSANEIILVPLIYRLYERKALQNNIYVLKCINTIKRS